MNAQFRGDNLVNGKANLVMRDVTYNDDANFGESAPVHCALWGFAEILDSDAVVLHKSFSVMVAVYGMPKAGFFYWGNERSIKSHYFEVWNGRLFINLLFKSCDQVYMWTKNALQEDEWHIVAVSFDSQTKMISLYIDGEIEQKQAPDCDSELNETHTGRVNLAWVIFFL